MSTADRIAGVDETHDAGLSSWVEAANLPDTDFPIQNLPLGVFRSAGSDETPRVGVAIGDHVFDLARARDAGLLEGVVGASGSGPDPLHGSLAALMAAGAAPRRALRRRVSEILRAGSPDAPLAETALVAGDKVELLLPAPVGDYTDFYAGIEHAQNVGSMLRPDEPLMPNYKYVPIAYHGRASSVVVSGTSVRRPLGQTKADDASPGSAGGPAPSFGATRALDYELELALWVGPGNRLGDAITIAEADDHLFGVGLLNDWSARDVQSWEYRPLGPFLSKSFATSVSPWVVTMEALAPFRVPAYARPAGDPEPLPYLSSPADRERGGIDLRLEAWLRTPRMREEGMAPARLSRTSFREMYWTAAQMLTHHTSSGCNLNPGDLIASGTVSGPALESAGCLLERAGGEALTLPTGEIRRFLEDGDEVTMRGYCERAGFVRIGFGECRGEIVAMSR